MIRKLIPIILIALALSACGIKRDNPLDPHFNDSIINPPEDVQGLNSDVRVAGNFARYIDLTWNSNTTSYTDGYYVYRSLGYFSAYAIVDTVLHVANEPLQRYIHSSDNDPTVRPGDFWYRVSAYKEYPEGRLEGRLCPAHFVRIPG